MAGPYPWPSEWGTKPFVPPAWNEPTLLNHHNRTLAAARQWRFIVSTFSVWSHKYFEGDDVLMVVGEDGHSVYWHGPFPFIAQANLYEPRVRRFMNAGFQGTFREAHGYPGLLAWVRLLSDEQLPGADIFGIDGFKIREFK